MIRALVFLCLLVNCLCAHLIAQSSPDLAIQHLESVYGNKGLYFDRTKISPEKGQPQEFKILISTQTVWGKDPETGALEGLVLFTPIRGRKDGLLVWVKERLDGRWAHRKVRSVQFSPGCNWRVWALSAEMLATYQEGVHFLSGQDIKLPAAPIEFHLDESDDGLSNPAQVFHPSLGLAAVVNGIQDDSNSPVPSGQKWGTHARGESLDLPSSSFKRSRSVLRQRCRVWFRLDKELFVADASSWDSWTSSFGKRHLKARLTASSTQELSFQGDISHR